MCASNKHAELAAVQTVGRAPFSHAHEHEAAIALLQSDRVALLRNKFPHQAKYSVCVLHKIFVMGRELAGRQATRASRAADAGVPRLRGRATQRREVDSGFQPCFSLELRCHINHKVVAQPEVVLRVDIDINREGLVTWWPCLTSG